jgi:elongation factor P
VTYGIALRIRRARVAASTAWRSGVPVDRARPPSYLERAPMLSTGDFKRGLRILIEGDPYVILDVHVQSPSARGASSLSKLKVRNLRTGQVFDKTFRGGDKVEQPDLELRPVQFLYRDADGFHFMDQQSYDQFALGTDDVGDAAGFLTDGLEGIRSVVFNGRVISIDLPNTVVLRVTQTDPALKGATAQAQTKPATLETGLVIQVPSYLESDELVQVDTRDARFVARVRS